MLTEYKHNNWRVLMTDRDPAVAELFNKFLDGGAKVFGDACTALKNGRTGPVYKIEFRGKKYVLKHDLRKRHRFDNLVSSFFRGSNSFRLLTSFEKAMESDVYWIREGGRKLPVAEVFLVADRRCCHCVLESFILMEFVEGQAVCEIPDGIQRYGKECALGIAWLHGHGMVHGDVNRENFLVDSTGTVRAIDLSGKPPTAVHKADDRFWLEKQLGVKNEIWDCGDVFLRLKSNFHSWSRKLRGKN